jgi:hypothetical protein
MDIASQQINIEAVRLLFSPTLIAAAAAVWLVLTSGAAGHIVLRFEEISAGFRVPTQQPAPASGATPDERHQAARQHPTCPRSQPKLRPVVKLGNAPEHLGPISVAPYLRIEPHIFDLGAFRPSVSRARDERGVQRRHQFARRAPDDEGLVSIGAPLPSERRLRRAVTER